MNTWYMCLSRCTEPAAPPGQAGLESKDPICKKSSVWYVSARDFYFYLQKIGDWEQG